MLTCRAVVAPLSKPKIINKCRGGGKDPRVDDDLSKIKTFLRHWFRMVLGSGRGGRRILLFNGSTVVLWRRWWRYHCCNSSWGGGWRRRQRHRMIIVWRARGCEEINNYYFSWNSFRVLAMARRRDREVENLSIRRDRELLLFSGHRRRGRAEGCIIESNNTLFRCPFTASAVTEDVMIVWWLLKCTMYI